MNEYTGKELHIHTHTQQQNTTITCQSHVYGYIHRNRAMLRFLCKLVSRCLCFHPKMCLPIHDVTMFAPFNSNMRKMRPAMAKHGYRFFWIFGFWKQQNKNDEKKKWQQQTFERIMWVHHSTGSVNQTQNFPEFAMCIYVVMCMSPRALYGRIQCVIHLFKTIA